MRFVEGSDLGSLLKREGKLTVERGLGIVAQVAGALDAAHERGLVHRDVKPANVLLDRDEHVYLTDFGITKQLGSGSTDTGQMVGTLDYLAPEQIRGDPVDGRTDVYALACVFYECLAGRRRSTAAPRRRRCGRTCRTRRLRCVASRGWTECCARGSRKRRTRAIRPVAR